MSPLFAPTTSPTYVIRNSMKSLMNESEFVSKIVSVNMWLISDGADDSHDRADRRADQTL